MRVSFFGTRKPKGFEYKPIYWDPEKEERLERQKLAEMLDPDTKLTDENYTPGSIIRASRARRMERTAGMQKSSRVALIRVLIFFLLVGFVIFLMSDLLVGMF